MPQMWGGRLSKEVIVRRKPSNGVLRPPLHYFLSFKFKKSTEVLASIIKKKYSKNFCCSSRLFYERRPF